MNTIGLIANLDKPNVNDAIRHVCCMTAGMGFKTLAEASIAAICPSEQVCEVSAFTANGVEAVVVLGGDGTMLDAAHRLAGQHLPMMGLNLGSLGYLTSVEAHQFGKALQQLREDRYEVSLRSALSIAVRRAAGSTVRLPDALNDAVVSRGGSGCAIVLELELDEKSVSRFLCDGIIVATPTGSTAYSLSAGGPIVLPDADVLAVSLICPHTLTSRPLIVRDTVRVGVRPIECAMPMIVSSDGRDREPVQIGDRVEIGRSPHRVPIIELHGYNPCDVLRRKLRWGGR